MELLFTGEFPPMHGGIGSLMHSRCRRAPRDGLRVLAADVPGSQAWDAGSGLDVHRFGYHHGGSLRVGLLRFRQALWAKAALDRELRGQHYRAVVANVLWPFGWAAANRKRKGGHRVALFCHGAELLRAVQSAPARWIYRHTMPKVDLYIANSKLTADLLVSHGWERGRIRVIPPGIDAARFRPGLDGSRFRRQWTGHNATGPVILTVCRLDDLGKGVDTMLRAIVELRRDFPEIRYVVIGDGRLRAYYERLARDLGVAEHVIFAGAVGDADLPLCYAACDVFVLMSRFMPEAGYYEGFGIVYREAMACAKPVVVSREAGFRDYVINGETGLLADPQSVEDVCRACREVLRDTAAAAELGRRAARFASEEVDWSPLNELA